jgi:hypothetical protein
MPSQQLKHANFFGELSAQETIIGAAQTLNAHNAISLTRIRIRTATSWVLTPG